MTDHRTFDTGATRDIDDWKLEYSRYIHPLADYSFAEYMKSKQIIWWEYRRWDNWQKWIPPESLFDSLIRHIEIVKLLYKGYNIIEVSKDWKIDLIVENKLTEINLDMYDRFDIKNLEQELNAVRFNSEALKLNIIKDGWYNYV